VADTKKFKTGMGIGKKIGIGVGIFFGAIIALGIYGSTLPDDTEFESDTVADQMIEDAKIQQSIPSEKIIPKGEKNNPANIDDTIVVEYIAFKVTKISTTDSIGDSLFGEKPDGVFIIIDLAMENRGDESVQIIGDYFTLIDSEDRKFDTDNEAWIYLKENVFLKQLQPSLPTTGQIVFDVPPHEETYVLEISLGIFGFDKKYVNLGSIGAN